MSDIQEIKIFCKFCDKEISIHLEEFVITTLATPVKGKLVENLVMTLTENALRGFGSAYYSHIECYSAAAGNELAFPLR